MYACVDGTAAEGVAVLADNVAVAGNRECYRAAGAALLWGINEAVIALFAAQEGVSHTEIVSERLAYYFAFGIDVPSVGFVDAGSREGDRLDDVAIFIESVSGEIHEIKPHNIALGIDAVVHRTSIAECAEFAIVQAEAVHAVHLVLIVDAADDVALSIDAARNDAMSNVGGLVVVELERSVEIHDLLVGSRTTRDLAGKPPEPGIAGFRRAISFAFQRKISADDHALRADIARLGADGVIAVGITGRAVIDVQEDEGAVRIAHEAPNSRIQLGPGAATAWVLHAIPSDNVSIIVNARSDRYQSSGNVNLVIGLRSASPSLSSQNQKC